MKSIRKKKLTIIIPCYNENNTIEKIVKKIKAVNLQKELIIVDDKSTDGSKEKIKKLKYNFIKKKIYHKKNLGKGACIKSAIKYINSEFVIIQDADLEYDPKDYKKLLKPLTNKEVKVVYGSRVLNKRRYTFKKSFFVNFRVFSNHVLTVISNIINKQSLTDAHTCYKIFETNIFRKLKVIENDFAFCPEVTTKISNLKLRIKEIPISYKGRGYDQGKKIGIYDAFRVLIVILKNKLLK